MIINKLFFNFCHFLAFGLIVSCVSSQDNTENAVKLQTIPYHSRQVSLPFLTYKYTDLNPYQSPGLGFTPMLMPLKADVNLSGADFLVGYWKAKNEPVLPPSAGSCRLIESEEQEKSVNFEVSKVKQRLVHFYSSAAEKDAEELFLLLNEDQETFALVRLDKRGEANCFLKTSSFYISTGYGQLRSEFPSTNKENNYLVPFFPKSKISVNPTTIANTGIYEGDILRIGRNISTLSQLEFDEKFSEDEGEIFTPLQIASVNETDLFTRSNFQSKRMNVGEYFKPSILVGKTPFNMSLEDASYTFAILRKNKLVCLQQVDLKGAKDFQLSCPDDKISAPHELIENPSENYYFDATFFPATFLESTAFQDWIFASPSYFMIAPEQNGFLFLMPHSESRKAEYLDEIYSFENSDKGFAHQIQSNLPNLKIPLGGEGEEALAQGAVPFSAFTKVNVPFLTQDFLLHSNTQASNGVILKWYEPYPSIENEGILSNLVEQNFRIRIMVPEWNSTNIVEMYVNHKFFQRWILDRGDLAAPYAITLDTKTAEKKDFTVNIIARGQDFLADFLSGTKNTLPFAATRDYHVKIEGNRVK